MFYLIWELLAKLFVARERFAMVKGALIKPMPFRNCPVAREAAMQLLSDRDENTTHLCANNNVISSISDS